MAISLPQVTGLSNATTIVNVSTGASYESVVVLFDDGTHQSLKWDRDYTERGMSCTWLSDTQVWSCVVGGQDTYLIESWRYGVMFPEGERLVDGNVIVEAVLVGGGRDVIPGGLRIDTWI